MIISYKLKWMYILLVFILFIIGCDKNNIPDPIDQPKSNLDTSIVWQYSRPDSLIFFSMKPIVSDNSVLFSLNNSDEINYTNKIISFNKKSGYKNWSWGESGKFNTLGTTISEDGAFISCHHRNYSFIINKSTGLTIWKDISERKEPKGNIVGNYFYTSVSSSTYDTMYLIRSSLKNLNWDTLFFVTLFENNQNFLPGIDQPKLWMNPQGDSILLVPDRMIRKGGSAYRFDIYAFNLSKRKMEWRLENFTPNGHANADPLLIKDNLCFVVGEDINCIDLITVKQKWNVDIDSYVGNAKIIVEEGKVIAKMHNTDLVALDMYTGNTIWINKYSGDDPLGAGLAYFQGYVYCNVGRGHKAIIARFDINTGIENWTYESSNGKFFSDGTAFDMTPITVDRETGLIYASDRFNVLCIRPPK